MFFTDVIFLCELGRFEGNSNWLFALLISDVAFAGLAGLSTANYLADAGHKPILEKGRPGAVVRAVSLSHQVMGSKQHLYRFCGGKTCLGLSLPQTPLMWEPPALGLPFFMPYLPEV